MSTKFVNTKKQGDYGLGRAIAHFTALGHTVLIPLTDSQDYDLAIDDGISLRRVQVKTTNYTSKYGVYKCDLRLIGGTTGKVLKLFNPLQYDVLYVVTPSHEYAIPSDEIGGSSMINLGKVYDKFRVGWTGGESPSL